MTLLERFTTFKKKKKKDIHFFITLDKMEDFSFLFLHSRMSNLFYIVNCKGVLAI
jgi:hypothetical protein